MGTLNIYIATPVNGRTEATKELKQEAARQRVEYLRKVVKAVFPDAKCWSSFDLMIPSVLRDMSEGEIMGRCVQLIIDKIDLFLLDKDHEDSKGCFVEYCTADTYEKQMFSLEQFREQFAIQLNDFGL